MHSLRGEEGGCEVLEYIGEDGGAVVFWDSDPVTKFLVGGPLRAVDLTNGKAPCVCTSAVTRTLRAGSRRVGCCCRGEKNASTRARTRSASHVDCVCEARGSDASFNAMLSLVLFCL